MLDALTLITFCKKGSMYNHQNILTTAPPHPLSGEFFLAKEEHVFHTIEVHSKREKYLLSMGEFANAHLNALFRCNVQFWSVT